MVVPLWLCFAVLGAVLIMLLVDLVAHRDAHVIGGREAAARKVVLVLCGAGSGAYIWCQSGGGFGQQYFAGYLIEKSLALISSVASALYLFAAFLLWTCRRMTRQRNEHLILSSRGRCDCSAAGFR